MNAARSIFGLDVRWRMLTIALMVMLGASSNVLITDVHAQGLPAFTDLVEKVGPAV